jgi:hypothetical protein
MFIYLTLHLSPFYIYIVLFIYLLFCSVLPSIFLPCQYIIDICPFRLSLLRFFVFCSHLSSNSFLSLSLSLSFRSILPNMLNLINFVSMRFSVKNPQTKKFIKLPVNLSFNSSSIRVKLPVLLMVKLVQGKF